MPQTSQCWYPKESRATRLSGKALRTGSGQDQSPVASQTAVAEYLDLWEATENVILSDQPDRTMWRWTPDGRYSAKSAYDKLHTGSIPFRGHALVWKTWALLRVKIFVWLAFRKRHWTNDRRHRHGLQAQDECFLCDQAPKSIDHLLSCCPYTRELLFHICTALGSNCRWYSVQS